MPTSAPDAVGSSPTRALGRSASSPPEATKGRAATGAAHVEGAVAAAGGADDVAGVGARRDQRRQPAGPRLGHDLGEPPPHAVELQPVGAVDDERAVPRGGEAGQGHVGLVEQVVVAQLELGHEHRHARVAEGLPVGDGRLVDVGPVVHPEERLDADAADDARLRAVVDGHSEPAAVLPLGEADVGLGGRGGRVVGDVGDGEEDAVAVVDVDQVGHRDVEAVAGDHARLESGGEPGDLARGAARRGAVEVVADHRVVPRDVDERATVVGLGRLGHRRGGHQVGALGVERAAEGEGFERAAVEGHVLRPADPQPGTVVGPARDGQRAGEGQRREHTRRDQEPHRRRGVGGPAETSYGEEGRDARAGRAAGQPMGREADEPAGQQPGGERTRAGPASTTASGSPALPASAR